MKELDDKTHAEIKRLSQIGDELAEKEEYHNALSEYWKAFDLLPEPKTEWEATTWLLAAIGDTNFLMNDFQAGVNNLSNVMHSPGAIGNPFLHLRLGQCLFEIGNQDKAANELTRAYAIEGNTLFSNEDPKYFEFLKTRINLDKPKKKPWWKF